MSINPARYAVVASMGTFAVSSCVVAYPSASFIISISGSLLVGLLSSFAAQFGEDKS